LRRMARRLRTEARKKKNRVNTKKTRGSVDILNQAARIMETPNKSVNRSASKVRVRVKAFGSPYSRRARLPQTLCG
jgi:hypothetical protein